MPPSPRDSLGLAATPVSPESIDLEATLAATRWLAAVGVESHLDSDLLCEIVDEPASLRALAPQRRHLRACGACRRQWLELRAQAAALGAALPVLRPSVPSEPRASWTKRLRGLFDWPARAGGRGMAGAGWAVAAVVVMSLVAVRIGVPEQAATQRITAHTMSPSEAAQLLRSLGPQAMPYGQILETQGLEALERRLREDESQSPIAHRARCLLLKRETCR